jgi:hypothetical protein
MIGFGMCERRMRVMVMPAAGAAIANGFLRISTLITGIVHRFHDPSIVAYTGCRAFGMGDAGYIHHQKCHDHNKGREFFHPEIIMSVCNFSRIFRRSFMLVLFDYVCSNHPSFPARELSNAKQQI